MSVPGAVDSGSSNDDSTRSLTLYLPANSTERICSTLEPRLAISSISSNVTRREPARLGNDARVGRVDAVDVGVDLAFVGGQRRGQRDARRIGAAAAEGGDVAVGIHALEAGDDDDRARRQIAAHVGLVDLEDARLGVGVVGQDAHLPAGVAAAPCSPSSCNAIASRPMVTCSPVAATTSSSRGLGSAESSLRQSRAAGWSRPPWRTARRRPGGPARGNARRGARRS